MDEKCGKKLIQIDVLSDTICPWCLVGKKSLDKAMNLTKDRFDFEVRWHPFLLSPISTIEGLKKTEYYRMKFGDQAEIMSARLTKVFKDLGYEYDMDGLR